MKVYLCLGFLLLFGSLLLVGCGSEQKATAVYPIKGKVVAVDMNKPSVKLDHEDIPGLMKGMAMSFDVENPKVLEGLKPGDQVEGHLKVEGGRYIVTDLKKP